MRKHKLNHIKEEDKYLFIKRNSADRDIMAIVLNTLVDGNDLCASEFEKEGVCFGIVPSDDGRSFNLRGFAIKDIKKKVRNAEIYEYEEFAEKFLGGILNSTVICRPFKNKGLQIGKVVGTKLVHENNEDYVRYTVDLSRKGDSIHKCHYLRREDILGTYEEIFKCLWHPITMYSNDFPEERENKYTKAEHLRTESDEVVVWDSFYGPRIDKRVNGEWLSEKIEREKKVISASVFHYDVAWLPLTSPEVKRQLPRG